ncbi:TPA: DUF551 domain-containing protein [Klebsiella pneumoniae]
MTKSTITREQVIALIAEHSYDSALVDALEHLLAAMDIVPQKHERRRCKDKNCNKPIYGYSVDGLCEDCYAAASQKPAPASEPVVYASKETVAQPAQPAPVVPDELKEAATDLLATLDDYPEQLVPINRKSSVVRALRAAMLQAGNSPEQNGDTPAQSQGWIPVSEQMPPSRHEVLVGRWWGEKPRWCCKWATYIPGHPDAQSSGWLIPGASWTPTHWMPLPAAPQEVGDA